MSLRGDAGIHQGGRAWWNALFSEGQAVSLVRNRRRPTRTHRFICVNTGSPTRREAQGDGTPRVTGWFSEGATQEIGPEHAR